MEYFLIHAPLWHTPKPYLSTVQQYTWLVINHNLQRYVNHIITSAKVDKSIVHVELKINN